MAKIKINEFASSNKTEKKIKFQSADILVAIMITDEI